MQRRLGPRETFAAMAAALAIAVVGCGDEESAAPSADGMGGGSVSAEAQAEPAVTITAGAEEPPGDDDRAPPAPELTVQRQGDELQIDYGFAPAPAGAPEPWLLLTSVAPVDGETPPLTLRTPIEPGSEAGTVVQPLGEATGGYTVRATVLAEDGRRSAVVEKRFP